MAKKKLGSDNQKYVMVVESPGKISTIKKILESLGHSSTNFNVVASYGHILELEKGAGGIDKKTFEPKYIVSADKKNVVDTLKKYKKDGWEILLSSDNDREGSFISYSISMILDLPIETTKRIIFNEITKKAIEEALKNPTIIDMPLTKSQQARRLLDRLTGFSLSPLLWKKIGNFKLSAGRVQSIAVKILTERDKLIRTFESDVDFKTSGIFKTEKDITIKGILDSRFKNKKESSDFLNKLLENKNLTVLSKEVKPGKKSAVAPFTTSTIQQVAGNKFSWDSTKIMAILNDLYVGGHTSYLRTDSVTLSEDAVTSITSEVKSKYGENYSSPRQYKSKNINSQNAHEAVRPTHFENSTLTSVSADEKKLYELIWKRTMASQMSDAITEITTITLGDSSIKEKFIIKGETIKFDGFLRVYDDSKDDVEVGSPEDEENDNSKNLKILPPMEKGDKLNIQEIISAQAFTKSPPRYNEPGLVKDLESKGIGRPSTFASIIRTIIERGYCVKKDIEPRERKIQSLTLSNNVIEENEKTEKYGGEKSKLVPTDTAFVVTDYLEKSFPEIMSYKFTSETEKLLDDIADGKIDWKQMLSDFYTPFEKKVREANGSSEKEGIRILGTDPSSGKQVSARVGRFGAMVQLGESQAPAPKESKESPKSKTSKKTLPAVPDTDKPKFAKLKEGQSIETITLEEAMTLLSWPKIIGKQTTGTGANQTEEDVKLNIGKFGPYVQIGKVYCSIPKEEDINNITLKRALELFKEKETTKASSELKNFRDGEILVLNGKFGPYIKTKTGNFKIPAGTAPESLTLADCEAIISGAPAKKKFVKRKK